MKEILDKQELLEYASKQLNKPKEDFIWSELCRNPTTNYNHPDGTIKGKESYWVLKG